MIWFVILQNGLDLTRTCDVHIQMEYPALIRGFTSPAKISPHSSENQYFVMPPGALAHPLPVVPIFFLGSSKRRFLLSCLLLFFFQRTLFVSFFGFSDGEVDCHGAIRNKLNCGINNRSLISKHRTTIKSPAQQSVPALLAAKSLFTQ